MSDNQDQTIEHFRTHGWMRVHQAFHAGAARAMRDVVWAGLAQAGVLARDPSTWTIERPGRLQGLKAHRTFAAIGSQRLLDTITTILGTTAYEKPKSWGALFVAFPSDEAWVVPTSGWHADANYRSQLWPPKGVQIHSLFGDVLPRSGATQILSGSHRLIQKWFSDHPPPVSAKSPEMRKLLRGHPYIRDLHSEGDPDERIKRFMNVEEVDGIPLQVIENTGSAGDVVLLHPLTLHVAAPNNGAAPRFLLSGSISTDMHGWA